MRAESLSNVERSASSIPLLPTYSSIRRPRPTLVFISTTAALHSTLSCGARGLGRQWVGLVQTWRVTVNPAMTPRYEPTGARGRSGHGYGSEPFVQTSHGILGHYYASLPIGCPEAHARRRSWVTIARAPGLRPLTYPPAPEQQQE